MAVILDDIRPNFPIVRCRDSVDHFIFCTTWYKIVKLKASLYIWDMNQALGQDGWILAKSFFCVFMDREEVELGQYPASRHAW